MTHAPVPSASVPPPVPADPADAPYLAGLNAPQREAVLTVDGPVLVLAGAGTGKTRVLTTRIGHILLTRRAFPSQMLAVTFTNKAAREMRERVERLIGGPAESIWLGTFHAIAARILRRHAELVGLRPNFTILDTDDQNRLLKQVMEAARVDAARWPVRLLSALIQRFKDRGLAPGQLTPTEGADFAEGRVSQLYAAYQERLRTVNAVDFGDLLLLNLTLFKGHPEVLAEFQRRFRYILVDEYQDTNVAQYLWLRLLAQGHRNLCCVGDDDQSIYGWRGAEIGNILRFEHDFPGAAVIRLEENYRSSPHVLGAASGLIAHNEGRLGKTLWTRRGDGPPVAICGVWDGDEEARLVAEEIEAQQRQRIPLSDIAILVRAGFQTRAFEERFLTVGLPYRVIGGPRFYERQEIRDAIAYLRMVAQPDDDLAFERIVNVPRRGIGDATLRAVHALARSRPGLSLVRAAAELVQTDELKPASRRSLRALLDQFAAWRAQLDAVPHAALAGLVLDESGYTAMWQADRSPEAPGRLDNLKELVRALTEFETLTAFLEHVSLVMEIEAAEAGAEMVSIMTLHAAKGLEFDTVYLPGWEEGLFPHQRALDESGRAGLEEERRLAYVGLTRAKRRCDISFAANRRIYNTWQSSMPSRFLDELPAEHVEVVSSPGVYAGRASVAEPAADWSVPVPRPPAAPAPRPVAAPRPPARPGTRPQAAPRPRENPVPAVGSRVFHEKFGYGRVAAADGDKLEIAFEKAGTKKVIASFVTGA